MLNENPDEFTCHEKGRNILLQLRMLLGNNMNFLNGYSFCIETFLNKSDWKIVVDKRDETVSGWQEFDFEPQPVAFIRITGNQSDIVNIVF